MIYKTILIGSALAAASVSPVFAQTCMPGDNLVGENTYEVLRKGKPIGTHTISFYGAPGAMSINAQTEMQVDVLFITAFKYSYDSTETYCGDTLESAMTYVDDNGKDKAAEVKRTASNYLSQSYKGTFILEPPFATSNHWNPDVVKAASILNTATGKLESVTVTPPASADENGIYVYQVRGDIDYNTRYDAAGQWLGMDFDHPKGGEMEFRCIDCRNTPESFITQMSTPGNAVSFSTAQ